MANLPKYPINKIAQGSPATTDTLNAPLNDIDENLDDLDTRMNTVSNQLKLVNPFTQILGSQADVIAGIATIYYDFTSGDFKDDTNAIVTLQGGDRIRIISIDTMTADLVFLANRLEVRADPSSEISNSTYNISFTGNQCLVDLFVSTISNVEDTGTDNTLRINGAPFVFRLPTRQPPFPLENLLYWDETTKSPRWGDGFGWNHFSSHPSASGGIIYEYEYGGIEYAINKFITSGTLTVIAGPITVDILLVGGGGGGGGDYYTGGGGGGGGLVWITGLILNSGNYVITVGAGGAGMINGGDTTWEGSTYVASGGGAGSPGGANPGNNGGSAGGGHENHQGGVSIQENYSSDPIANGYGNNGAPNHAGSGYGGGGGGAGSAPTGIEGGQGHTTFVDESSVATNSFLLAAEAGSNGGIAGGGGGGSYYGPTSNAYHGGGVGGYFNPPIDATSALANTGGGGGGRALSPPPPPGPPTVGTGGSGIAIIRYIK